MNNATKKSGNSDQDSSPASHGVATSSSASSLRSLPEMVFATDPNTTGVVVPPQVPPRKRRGSDSSAGSSSSPRIIKRQTVGGLGGKPSIPKVEALKQDSFCQQPFPSTSSPPKPPPRGHFLKAGGKTQSCIDVLQSTEHKRPSPVRTKSEEGQYNAKDKKDNSLSTPDGIISDNSVTSQTPKTKNNEIFFVLQPNSSALMTTTTKVEDTPYNLLNSVNNGSIAKRLVPLATEPETFEGKNSEVRNKGGTSETDDNVKNVKALSNSNLKSLEDTQLSPISKNKTITSNENERMVEEKQSPEHTVHEKEEQEAKDGCKSLSTNLVEDEDKLKANESSTKNEVPRQKDNCNVLKSPEHKHAKDEELSRDNDIQLPKAVEKVVLRGDSNDNCSTISKNESTVACKLAGDKTIIANDRNAQECTRDKTVPEKSKEKCDVIHIKTDIKNTDQKQDAIIRPSGSCTNDLTLKDNKVPPLSSKRQTGMFENVIGNFTFSEVLPLPTVSTVTKSLPNGLNIDISASKLSKVVKFDISATKV